MGGVDLAEEMHNRFYTTMHTQIIMQVVCLTVVVFN